jgi:Fur family transcriptional regulator, stress-responsive regulator
MLSETDAAERLRARGLRVTKPRLAVLSILSRGGHLRVDEVRRHAVDGLGAVSVQAVYDVLNTLAEAELVRRIEPAGSPTKYEFRVGDNHHHLVCRRCGRVEDVDCATGRRACLHPSDNAGFVVDEAEVTYWGLCPQCQTSQAEGAT